MDIVFEVLDKTGRRIRLTHERLRHIKKHPHMDEHILEDMKQIIKDSFIVRYDENKESLRYYYKEYKDMPLEERYLFISVKYLNGDGFIITSFFTNKITGTK